MGIIHAIQSLVVGCEFPLWMQYAVVAYAGSILALFLNFYFHAYVKSRRQKVQVISVILFLASSFNFCNTLVNDVVMVSM